MAGQPGEGYPNAAPPSLQIELACGASGAFVNISNYVAPTSVSITRDGRGRTASASFQIRAPGGAIAGTVYDIHDNQEVHIWDNSPDPTGAGIARYNRKFAGYTRLVTSKVEGAVKVYTVSCWDFGVLLDRPTKQITTQWPPGDGSPVINTTSLTPITAGAARTFVPRNTTNLYDGKKVIAQNCNGTNKERITVHLSGGVWSADFLYPKTVSDTTITSGAVAQGIQTVTVGSMTGITSSPAATLIIQDPDGSNEELVVVTGIAGSTFTANFTLAHPPGSLVKVRWQLVGGISAYDLLAGGFQAVDSQGVLQTYQGFLDVYYNNVGQTVSKNAVTDYGDSLPHMKAENTTPRKFLDDVVAAATSTAINTTSATVVSGPFPKSVTFTPDTIYGIYLGQLLTAQNPDGSNKETIEITAMTSSTATATFTSSKSAGWQIIGAIAPQYYMTFIQDSADHTAPWTPQLVWLDRFDATKRTTIVLKDVTVLNPSTQARYNVGYARELDGGRRIFRQTVSGAAQSQGTYTDPNIPAGMRVIEGEPIVDQTITTNADAAARAQAQVLRFNKPRETVRQVVTYAEINPYLFYEAHTVQWGHTLEGGTPATYAIAQVTLDYSEGVGKYTFELGDAFEELGDSPQPVYGSTSTGIYTPPAAVTWPSGSSWVLSNQYDDATRTSTGHLQWNANVELNLSHYYIQWYFPGETPWSRMQRVNAPAHDFFITGVPGALVTLRVFAVNLAGQYRDLVRYPPEVKTFTLAGVSGPPPPTGLTRTRDVYLDRQTVEEAWSWTPGGGSTQGYTVQLDSPGRSSVVATLWGASNTTWSTRYAPGVSVTLTVWSFDRAGNICATPLVGSYTTIAGPPTGDAYNLSFEIPDPTDATQPAGWTKTVTGAGSGALSTTQVCDGQQSIAMTVGGGVDSVSYQMSTRLSVGAPTLGAANSTYFLRVPYYSTANAKLNAYAECYDKTGAFLSEVSVHAKDPTTNGSWQVLETQFAIPSSTSYIQVKVKVSYSTFGLGAATVYVDGLQVGPVTRTPMLGAGAVGDTQLAVLSDPSKHRYVTDTLDPFAMQGAGQGEETFLVYWSSGNSNWVIATAALTTGDKGLVLKDSYGNAITEDASGVNIATVGGAGNGFSINGGARVQKHLTATASLNYGLSTVGANSTMDKTITVTGAAVGDTVIVTPNGDPGAGIVWSGFVSAANTVTVRVGNVRTVSVSPATLTWRADVWSY